MVLLPKRSVSLRWTLFVCLVLACFLTGQVEAAIDSHQHQHGGPNSHCCAGCHGVHVPVVSPEGGYRLQIPLVAAGSLDPDESAQAVSCARLFIPSRAPPSPVFSSFC